MSPVERFEGGTVWTGESIDHYRLLVLKTALGADLKGIQVRPGLTGAIICRTILKLFPEWDEGKKQFSRIYKQLIYDKLCEHIQTIMPKGEK